MATRRRDNFKGARRGRISEPLARAVNDAIDTVYGSDYSYEARSGVVHPGAAGSSSGRHVTKQGSKAAADWKIYDPSGRQLAGRELDPFARHWTANYGSIGINSKPGEQGENFTHLDLVQVQDLRKGQAVAWTYGTIPGLNLAEIRSLAGTGKLYGTWAKPDTAMIAAGGPVTVGSAAASGAPTPPNPIPGIPDPSVQLPRANPLFNGPAPAPGTLANMWGREDFAVAGPAPGRLSPEYVRPPGPASLTQIATAGEDATASTQVALRSVPPTPVPRARPNQLEQTITRVLKQNGLLKKGTKGEAVKEIQRVLNARGVTDFRGRPLVVDGNLGTRTRQAIEIYQSLHPHLKSDGILGPRTLTQLMEDIESPTPIDVSTMTAQQQLAITNPEISLSPVASIAANMGANVARGFDAPNAMTSIPGVDPRWNYQPGMTVPGSPGYRIPSSGTLVGEFPSGTAPARPVSRTPTSAYPASVWEAANAFTPHSAGKLGGVSRGLSFETLDRDAESIYSATDAFARARVEANERGSSRLDFARREFEFGGSGDSFLRDSSGRRTFSQEESGTRSGQGNPSRAVSRGTGFTSRGTGGFQGRASQQAPGTRAGSSSGSQGAAGRTGQSGTGQSTRSSSQASPTRSTTMRSSVTRTSSPTTSRTNINRGSGSPVTSRTGINRGY